ncbi:MAG: PorT family protein [Cyclobacteriaceae bacterium]|jgi:hypothetical protein|nr:PorT family protein [Cyclobacteriaceae bacterium]
MRNVLVALIVVCFVPTVVFAQHQQTESPSQRLTFSARAGASLNQFRGTSTYTLPFEGSARDYKLLQDHQWGFNIAGMMDYRLSKRFSCVSELAISFEGAHSETERLYNSSGDFEYTQYSFEFTKLNLPVMLRYHVSKRVSFESGVVAGFFLKASGEQAYVNSYLLNPTVYTFNLLRGGDLSKQRGYRNERGVNPVDASLVFSVTWNVYKKIFTQVRYTYTLSSADMNLNFDGARLNSDFQMTGYQLFFGYQF